MRAVRRWTIGEGGQPARASTGRVACVGRGRRTAWAGREGPWSRRQAPAHPSAPEPIRRHTVPAAAAIMPFVE